MSRVVGCNTLKLAFADTIAKLFIWCVVRYVLCGIVMGYLISSNHFVLNHDRYEVKSYPYSRDVNLLYELTGLT